MNLAQLMAGLEIRAIHGQTPPDEVAGLAYDSRRVRPGYVFCAFQGEKADGHDFLDQAARAGALAAVVERPQAGADLPQVEVPEARLALARLADRLLGAPSGDLTVVGITGTNGKTTTAYLTECVLARRGPVGVVGTVEVRYPGHRAPAAMTTPQSLDLQEILAAMKGAGAQGAVLEVSSHALEQHRAEAIRFDAAVFTNLSRDHLDYHGDMERYFAAKERLFSRLLTASRAEGKPGLAVICLDDPKGSHLKGLCRELGLPVLTYGLGAGADVTCAGLSLTRQETACRVIHPGGSFAVHTPLVGRHNAQNLLAAAAVGLGLGLDPEEVAAGLTACHGVPGRLERVPGPGPAVFVDYAHSDAALTGVLAVLRPLTPGRLIVVFGAGGDRDRGKRPLMGRAAGRGADLAILTSDNPRSEDPLAIIAEIEPGLAETGCDYAVEPDRARAIARAVDAAEIDDVILIAGKGHEDYQIVGGERRHFDDREEAAAALSAWRESHVA